MGTLFEPGDYGFIPGTPAEDGDPLDVLTLVEEPRFTECMIEVRPVAPHTLREIEHFFTIYKQLENKRTRMRGRQGASEAFETIRKSRERYVALDAPQ